MELLIIFGFGVSYYSVSAIVENHRRKKRLKNQALFQYIPARSFMTNIRNMSSVRLSPVSSPLRNPLSTSF